MIVSTHESSCPYFDDGRLSKIEFFAPDNEQAAEYERYLERGYRRYGRIFYRNTCDGCTACLPLRLETSGFSPSRSQRRTLRKNRDIVLKVFHGSAITKEKLDLYEKYLDSKHHDDRPEEKADPLDSLAGIHYGYSNVIEMQYYLEDRLAGVGIVDAGKNSLSSNYFYYDTELLDRRPGIFSILSEISLAARLGKKYYYLGFYIRDNPKMAYKKYFRPNEIYRDRAWKTFMQL